MSYSYASTPVFIEWLRRWKFRIAFFLVMWLAPIVCESIVMSGWSGDFIGWLAALWKALAGLTLIGLFGVGVLGLFFLLFSATRRPATVVISTCFFAFISLTAGLVVSRQVRMHGFTQMACRTKPLIAAIEKFEKAKGHAPDKLSELVPKFLPSVPKTGIGAYPDFLYKRFNDETDPWELSVLCSVGLLNFDEFYYRPSKKYVSRLGGWIEPAGDWAYFHE